MEFDWGEEEITFRKELRGFLRERFDDSYWSQPRHRRVKRENVKDVLDFNRSLAEKGWLTPNWPAEYGGGGMSAWQHTVLSEELWSIGEPRGPQYMNVNWIGPAIMLAGTDDQKARYLPPISRGEVFWCQGFSEPDAGSDLGSLRTSAIRDGDEYVVNGQKIWTSHCQVADYCFLLVRTSPEGNRGITILLVPMDAPGLEVRPVAEFIGEGAFHELFFTDVRVPVSERLGEENEGWRIVRRALQFERVGAPRWQRASLVLDALCRRADESGLLDDPVVARSLGEARSQVEAARLLAYRVIDERAKGSEPSAAAYVARAAMVRAERAVADVAVEMMQEEMIPIESNADSAFREALVAGVAAGAYEIQLNLIAGLVLGLPRH